MHDPNGVVEAATESSPASPTQLPAKKAVGDVRTEAPHRTLMAELRRCAIHANGGSAGDDR